MYGITCIYRDVINCLQNKCSFGTNINDINRYTTEMEIEKTSQDLKIILNLLVDENDTIFDVTIRKCIVPNAGGNIFCIISSINKENLELLINKLNLKTINENKIEELEVINRNLLNLFL